MCPLPQTTPSQAILAPLRERPQQTAILCDVDGTLAPVVERPELAAVPAATRRVLERLAGRFGLVACISGRQALEARRIVGLDSLHYVGNHGLERLEPGAREAVVHPDVAAHADRVRSFAAERLDERLRRAGVRLEDKDAICAFHWRGAPDPAGARALLEGVAADAREAGLIPHWGRLVLEIRPTADVDKGTAVAAALAGTPLRIALYAGDDTTDLDAFRRLRRLQADGALELSVCVGVASPEGPAGVTDEADVVVADTRELATLLRRLAD